MDLIKRKLLQSLETTKYIYSPHQALLQDRRLIYPTPSVQDDWSNITITFLSLNRVRLSIRLLESIKAVIPSFQGKIFVLDNHSDPSQLNELMHYTESYPFPIALMEMEKNFGVAGGRNQAAQYIDTEWFLSVDNDMVFTHDPIQALKDAVGSLGAHFVNLPILQKDGRTVFACGGNLWVEPYQDSYVLGNSTAYIQTLVTELNIEKPFLSTFLFGGASLIRKDSFIEHGMFDDHMLIGFEDLEYSYRLFQKGIKVGNAREFCLVHAHEEPSIVNDIDYEKERYSREIIKSSAEYFYKKHGVYVWTEGVSKWLEERQPKTPSSSSENHSVDERSGGSQSQFSLSSHNGANKPLIGLVGDARGWVFENLCRILCQTLSQSFNFKVCFASEYESIGHLMADMRDCDLLHFFYRQDIYNLFNPYTVGVYRANQWDYRDFIENFIRNKVITTSVFDHLFLSDEEVEQREALFSSVISGYTVSSEKLFRIYNNLENYPPPTMIIEDGVDLQFFKPNCIERLKDSNREIIIGWAGNSKWGMEWDGVDHKGLETIIKVAVDELRNEGLPIRANYVDRDVNRRAYKDMPDYYNSIDIYVCASDIEGTPNTVLEAMACGVPIISTDVGIVPNVFGECQSRFIFNRNIVDLKEKIKKLVEDPELRSVVSNENLHRIQDWSWEKKTEKWGKFFQHSLQRSKSETRNQSETMVSDQRKNILRYRANIAELDYELEYCKEQNRIFSAQVIEFKYSRTYRMIERFRSTFLGKLSYKLARSLLSIFRLL